MRLSKYQLSLADALQNNATKNIIIAVLLGTNFLSVWGWFSSTETIVLVPPTLDERVIVSADDASAGYKTAWGLYVA
ncbi:MAG: TraE/TraK family type IV conjugative transfer system protein [Rhodospirillaceae bacterium]|nr:TraE/TraK family type IV conjugative transfer system protein [Rhodospirillaceae bacterium]